MNLLNKYMIFCAIILSLTPIVLSTLSSDKITATDWIYRHSVWIDRYLKGDFSPIYEYLPLFHWLMLPFVALQFPMKYFQIVFAVLSLFGILYFIYRMENERTLLITSMMLASSIAFVEFSSALMPQALDYIFFPFALIAYFKNHHKSVIAFLMAIFLMHPTGFIFSGILFIHSLFTKRYKFSKILLAWLLLLLPFTYYYLVIGGTVMFPNHYDYNAQIQWEMQYTSPIWKLFGFSGFLTWILLPFAFLRLYKNRFKLTETQSLYALWVLGFIPLMFFNYGIWRPLSYMIVPLSMFVASLISDKNEVSIKKTFNDFKVMISHLKELAQSLFMTKQEIEDE